MLTDLRVRFATIALLPALAGVAAAATILSPAAVINNAIGDADADNTTATLLDQSGLSIPFVSGVTDFDAYLAQDPLHATAGAFNEWFGPFGVTSGILDFDLGATYAIDRAAVWNEELNGVKDLSIYVSADPSFADAAHVGDFVLPDTPFGVPYSAEVLALTPTVGRYVRFEIVSSWRDYASLGEVAFSVPEPATGLALLIAFAGCRRRMRLHE